MTVSTKIIKKTAKTALRENWCNAIIVCTAMILFYYVCSLIAECIEYVLLPVVAYAFLAGMFFFMFAPVLLGVIRYFWRLLFDAKDNPAVIFYYFSDKKRYARALRVTFALGIRAVIFGFFVFLPAVVTKALSQTAFYDFFHLPIPLWSFNFTYVSLFLETVAKVLFFFYLLRFFAFPFLAVADEEMEIGEAIHRGKQLSTRADINPFSLIISFLGWLLLCLLALPAIFILPYFFTALSVEFRFIVAAYNKEAEGKQSGVFPAYDAT